MNPSHVMTEAVAIVLLAPAASLVASARRRQRPWATFRPVLLMVAALIALSIVAALVSRSAGAIGGWDVIVTTHITLAAAALAFAATGALCGRVCGEPLDAVAATSVVGLLVTFALLLAGDVAARLPTPIVNAGLVASPLVAVASAANIDVLRDDTWYRLSPIAHRSFDYPTWSHAAAAYLVVSMGCVALFTWRTEQSL